MNDLITLPSGYILNLALVACIAPQDGALLVTFAAGSATDPLRLALDTKDALALLDALGRRSMNVSATRQLIAPPPAA